jgi:hypothetical protein
MRSAAVPLALLLSACGSAGGSGIAPALWQHAAGGGAAGAAMTSAEADAFPYPLLMVRGDGRGWRRMVLQSVTAGAGAPRLTWLSADRRAIATVHGRIVAAAGGGPVLAGTLFQDPDPLAAPLAIPPDGITWRRSVDIMPPGEAGGGQFGVPLDCRIAPRAREVIGILGRGIDTIRLEETCRGPGLSFTGTFWVGVADAQVWRAEQWAGGDAPITFEVAKPPSAS